MYGIWWRFQEHVLKNKFVVAHLVFLKQEKDEFPYHF